MPASWTASSRATRRDYEKQRPLVFAPIHEATEEYWSKVFRTNALGTFLMMRAQLKQLVRQLRGGAIVNVGSIAGMTGLSGNPAYVASKHAVNGLTRNAAIDYAPYGIRVNSVNMAATDTPMIARAGALVAASMKQQQRPHDGPHQDQQHPLLHRSAATGRRHLPNRSR